MNALENHPAFAPVLHCQGSDCAVAKHATDWFGDVQSSEELEDSRNDAYGDRV